MPNEQQNQEGAAPAAQNQPQPQEAPKLPAACQDADLVAKLAEQIYKGLRDAKVATRWPGWAHVTVIDKLIRIVYGDDARADWIRKRLLENGLGWNASGFMAWIEAEMGISGSRPAGKASAEAKIAALQKQLAGE